jgi:hypothetical protein
VAVDRTADRYVRWLYTYASALPDLALLGTVAGAVAALEHPPADLVDTLHDELALVLAALKESRPATSIAIARLRPRSPVLALALENEHIRGAACAALAHHLEDAVVLRRYLELLTSPDPAVLTAALSGLGASGGVAQVAAARAGAVPRQLPPAIQSSVVSLLGHADPDVVASALRVLEGRDLPADLPARVAGLAGVGDAAIAAGARLVLAGQVLPVSLLADLIDLLPAGDQSAAATAQLILARLALPDDLLYRLARMLAHDDRSVAERAASLLRGRDLPASLLDLMVGFLEHRDALVAWSCVSVLTGSEVPAQVLPRVVALLGHDSSVVVRSALSVLASQELPDDVVDQVVALREHHSSSVVVAALGLLERRDLPEELLARVVGLLEHDDPTVIRGASTLLAGANLTDPLLLDVVGRARREQPGGSITEQVLLRITGLLDHGSPPMVAGALELLSGRDPLPADVITRAVELLAHPDAAVARAALSVLDGRPLPGHLVVEGTGRLLGAGWEHGGEHAGDVGAGALRSFLRGRELPAEAALLIRDWLSADPPTRWPIAAGLIWPPELVARMSAKVRALAAATALGEWPAVGELVAETSQRWLTG